MKRIVRLTENDLARIVRRVINESENMTIPMDLGFGIEDSPIGKVVDNRNQPVESWLPNVNLIIKAGAKVTKTSPTQCTIPGLLYFRKDGSKFGAKKDTGDMSGVESAKAIAGQSIPKTIYFDCSTSDFYTFYDTLKVVFFKSDLVRNINSRYGNTLDFLKEEFCGQASQSELASVYRK